MVKVLKFLTIWTVTFNVFIWLFNPAFGGQVNWSNIVMAILQGYAVTVAIHAVNRLFDGRDKTIVTEQKETLVEAKIDDYRCKCEYERCCQSPRKYNQRVLTGKSKRDCPFYQMHWARGTKIVIILDEQVIGGKVASGRAEGRALREAYGLDELEDIEEQITIVISDNLYSFNVSFFAGMFEDSIRHLGEKRFGEKYIFECDSQIRKNVEDGIRHIGMILQAKGNRQVPPVPVPPKTRVMTESGREVK